jgi:osmoprotectant transport system permease protein
MSLGSNILATGPVIPDFGTGVCKPGATFCWAWIVNNWESSLLPRLIEHIYITAIAVGVGLVIAVVAALIGYSKGWFARGFACFSTFLYTIPSLALFLMLVPITGLSLLTVEIGLVGYTLLLLFRNTLTGLQSAPPEVLAAATGMGMTRFQILFKVNLPLALPSIIAGIRIATVTVISLATIAAYVAPLGLGAPILFALSTLFDPQLVAAGGLAILLALVADAAVVLLGRLVTPWERARG